MRKNTRRGVKTYRPHGLGVFIYALFALAVVGGLAAFALFPMFTFEVGESTTYEFKGLDFLFFTLRQYLPSFAKPEFSSFAQYFDATPTNQLLGFICKFHTYIELAIAGFMALTALWAVILTLLSVFFILIGSSRHPKSLDIFSWLTFWFFAVAIGLSFMYLFFYTQVIGEGSSGVTATFNMSLYVWIILGGMFVLCILVLIIYKAHFKDRVPFKNKKKKSEEVVTIEDSQSLPFMNNQVNVQPQPQVNQSLPKGPDVITIGDRAYAKNTEMTSAMIPEGVVSLGSSAFANCVNLESVSLPSTVQEIGFNCFFNTPKLTSISYNGTLDQWKAVKRGSNWLMKSGTKTIQCLNGKVNVNPHH